MFHFSQVQVDMFKTTRDIHTHQACSMEITPLILEDRGIMHLMDQVMVWLQDKLYWTNQVYHSIKSSCIRNPGPYGGYGPPPGHPHAPAPPRESNTTHTTTNNSENSNDNQSAQHPSRPSSGMTSPGNPDQRPQSTDKKEEKESPLVSKRINNQQFFFDQVNFVVEWCRITSRFD